MKLLPSALVLGLLSSGISAAFADGVVHIPAPSGGFTGDRDEGLTFGGAYGITVDTNGLVYDSLYHVFSGEKIQLVRPGGGNVDLSVSAVSGDMTLWVSEGVRADYYLQVGTGDYPDISVDVSGILFSAGTTDFDTTLARSAPGVLQINEETIVTQNVLSNYVTLTGEQTLTNKTIDATQLTGSLSTDVLPGGVTQLGSSIDLETETAGNLEWSRVNKTGANLADLPDRAYADLQDKPTTLAGYGITDSIAVERDAEGRITTAIRIAPQGDILMGDFGDPAP